MFVVGVVVVIIALVVVCLPWPKCTYTETILTSTLTISPHPFYQSGFNDLGLIGESNSIKDMR